MFINGLSVFSTGWEEKALHEAMAVAAALMQQLVEGQGFVPWTKEAARERVKLGYVNRYTAFAKQAAVQK